MGMNNARFDVIACIPAQPPDWVYEQIDAEGTSARLSSGLRTKQAAEERATDAIRVKLLSLPLSPGKTVSEVARQSPAVHDAVERALSRARVYAVEYDSASGSVKVKMMLDPRVFWDEVSGP